MVHPPPAASDPSGWRAQVTDVDHRTGGLDDVDAVAALAVAVLGGDVERWRTRLRRALGQDGAHLVVAEHYGVPVGYGKAARCEPHGPHDAAPARTYLTGLVVLPAWRRRGIGKQLTRPRLDRIWAGGQPAWCFTNARNTASLALHARLGFVEVGRASSYLGEPFDGGVGVLLRADPPQVEQVGSSATHPATPDRVTVLMARRPDWVPCAP